MAVNKVGYPLASVGAITDIDAAATNPEGTRQFDDAGNEYIYLQGVANTVVGSCVTYGLSATDAFQTALSVTGVSGPVAFAMSACLAGQFGWYQIGGLAQALFNGAAVAGKPLYSASTGKVDDAVVSGDQITGAIVAATVSGAGLGAVFLSAPFMNHLG
jgi:hypothetical protein